jgi:hypothetical protein
MTENNEPKNLLEYIKKTLEQLGDSWDNVIAIWIGADPDSYKYDVGNKVSKSEAEEIFITQPPGSGYGGTEDTPFHIYTKDNLLFMGEYDGSEWISYIPLNPDKPRTVNHVGDG